MKLFTITYADGQPCPFTEHRNQATENLHRFEYNAMLHIADKQLANVGAFEMVGIFSHKLEQKTGLTAQQIRQRIAELETKTQLINLSPAFQYPIAGEYATFMDWSAAGHGELLRTLIKLCCRHVGFKYYPAPEHVVYANMFAAQKVIYKDYINTVIRPCLWLLEGPLWATTNRPANYTAGLTPKQLKETTGLPFYNYLPFVLERMTMQYIANRNIKTISL